MDLPREASAARDHQASVDPTHRREDLEAALDWEVQRVVLEEGHPVSVDRAPPVVDLETLDHQMVAKRKRVSLVVFLVAVAKKITPQTMAKAVLVVLAGAIAVARAVSLAPPRLEDLRRLILSALRVDLDPVGTLQRVDRKVDSSLRSEAEAPRAAALIAKAALGALVEVEARADPFQEAHLSGATPARAALDLVEV